MIRHGVPVELKPHAAGTFEGRVLGEPASLVRLTVRGDVFEGYVRTGDEWIFVDALSPVTQQPGTMVVYRDRDVRVTAAGGCGAAVHDRIEQPAPALGPALVFKAVTMPVLEVATDADAEFVAARGGVGGAFDRIATILNGVDGIFRSELDLDLVISGQIAWEDPGEDPYETTSAPDLLDDFGDYWNPSFPWIERDAAHLFTGKDLDGNAIGYSHIGTVCRNPSMAYALSQDYSTPWSPLNLAVKLAAHEIAHNLSAVHIQDLPKCSGNPSACAGVQNIDCDEFGPIMCEAINSDTNMTFSRCIQCGIGQYVDSQRSCL